LKLHTIYVYFSIAQKAKSQILLNYETSKSRFYVRLNTLSILIVDIIFPFKLTHSS